MATQAQINANRRNASSSTGPRTAVGKERSAQNALKHGLRARAITSCSFKLLSENPADFAALLDGLLHELRPAGSVEEMCVESIALALWRQARLIRAEQGHIAVRQSGMLPRADNPAGYARLALPDFETLDKLTRYEAHLDRQLHRALATLTRLQQTRLLSTSLGPAEPSHGQTSPTSASIPAEQPSLPRPSAEPALERSEGPDPSETSTPDALAVPLTAPSTPAGTGTAPAANPTNPILPNEANPGHATIAGQSPTILTTGNPQPATPPDINCQTNPISTGHPSP